MVPRSNVDKKFYNVKVLNDLLTWKFEYISCLFYIVENYKIVIQIIIRFTMFIWYHKLKLALALTSSIDNEVPSRL